jgi:glycosyltransferase involved in cell wall biosynthesis
MKNKITVLLTTCDRYDSTLPLCLMSIVNQTRLPDRIVLVDDSRDTSNNPFYSNNTIKYLLVLMKNKNISIDYFYGEKKGQVPALQLGLNKIDDGWVFKTDDDNVLDPNVLERFESEIKNDIGAISCLILDESSITRSDNDVWMSSKIEDVYSCFNVQMVGIQNNEPKFVEHIYSNYFFSRDLADNYPIELQPYSLREDTIFTHNIFRKGFKLLILPDVKIYHLGGDNNSGNRQWGNKYWEKNELFFLQKLKDWSVIPNKMKIYETENLIYTEKNNKPFEILKKK